MAAYYNEYDPHAAAWLRELIKRNLIAYGDVDERSIINVDPRELQGYSQHHFFAGIGGWSYALRLAGVSDDEPLWTASLPCQPFSAAGKQLGKDDERHLLPHFIELVRQCKPNRIFGEQVPGAIRHGWLDDLYTEMEQENYAVGACVLTAAGAGAYHIRQRLYWVANATGTGLERSIGQEYERGSVRHAECGSDDGLAYSKSERERSGKSRSYSKSWNFLEGSESRSNCQHNSKTDGMGDTKHNGHDASEKSRGNESSIQNSAPRANSTSESARASTPRIISEWSNPEWLYCRDNKHRPIKSGLKPLVDGVSERMVRSSDPSTQINADETQEGRVMRLKGYGNAIVPQVAAAFIRAAL